MADPHSLTSRMIRAAKLEVDLYEEVEADVTATSQAFQSVLIAGLASGIGSALQSLSIEDSVNFWWVLFTGVMFTVGGWIIWSYLTYWFGTIIFSIPETSATVGELLRTLGFAISPMVLSVFLFIPYLGVMIGFGAFVWMLIAGVIAVRQALDFTTGRAIGTCAVALIPYWALMFVIQENIL